MIEIKRLGHVVLRVRELERSVHFYRDVLGLKEVARIRDAMVFFSIDNSSHHDLAIMPVGAGASNPSPDDVGLYHVAFKIGDDIVDLKSAKQWLDSHGVNIVGLSDHTVSQSMYLKDPDGNELELYVDSDPAIWKNNRQAVASVKPLSI